MATLHAKTLVDQLHEAGLRLTVGTTGKLAVTPATSLNDDLRGLIREHRDALLDFVKSESVPVSVQRIEYPLYTKLPANDPYAAPPMVSNLVSIETVVTNAAVDKSIATETAVLDPDRWSYPHSSAMNGAEIDTFIARQDRFASKGLPLLDAESLADKLVLRDRDMDDRRLCLECNHLGGYGQISWRCANWQAAGVASRSRDAHLPQELVCTLQRCQGFNDAPLLQTLP